MGAAKSKGSAKSLPGLQTKLLRLLGGPWRRVVLVGLLLGAFLGGWYFVWLKVRDQVLSSDAYLLTPGDVKITPLPDWIRTDVRGQVLRDASLEGPLSIMDDDLTGRIASAFSLHPWVAKVQRVTKRHPAGVEVELVYRRPVCMVEVAADLQPVDVAGVLLPRDDFSQVEAARYPRLAGIDTAPLGPIGTRWGDGRVVDAAEIAAAFGSTWQQLKLDRISPAADSPAAYAATTTYELFTRSGTRILWGHGPASKLPSELPAIDKVARLKQYAAENGSLEGPGGPQVLDVRTLRPLVGTRPMADQATGGLR